MEKENRIYVIAISLFVLSLIVFLISVRASITGNIVLEEKELLTTLIIGDHTGFDLNLTALTFGMISTGSNANRKILFENDYDFPIKFEVSVEGNIAELIDYEREVYLEPGERREVEFVTVTISNETYGTYTGVIHTIIKRAT